VRTRAPPITPSAQSRGYGVAGRSLITHRELNQAADLQELRRHFSVVIDGDFSPMTRTSDLRPLTSAERRRRGGFTLLELLIVVGIVSLRPLGARTFSKGICSLKSGGLPYANFAFSPYIRTLKNMKRSLHGAEVTMIARSFPIATARRASGPCRALALREGGFALPKQRERASAFTLLELLIVVGIIGLLMVLIAPAFTTIKGGTDVTSAAYTIKGVLDTARTYAKANNTYTWVGFYEENVSNPASPNSDTPAVGRVIMSIVASKDGTTVYNPNSLATIDPTKLTQVGKLTKIDNVHLWTHTDTPLTPTGSTTYCIGNSTPADSATPFQYPVGNGSAQYTFLKAMEFSPRGEVRINNNSNSPQRAAEIAFEPTHGAPIPASVPANVAAIQVNGFAGDVKIYRR